jgi:hypothetical protein
MPTRRTRRLGALVATSALGMLALAGCAGGDEGRLTKREYERKVRAEYAQVQRAFRATDVDSLELLADRVADAQDALRDAADALDERDPPREVARENDQVVEGMRAYADTLDELREAAEAEDAPAVAAIEARGGLFPVQAIEQIGEAAEAMKFKGYNLGPIAEE